ncbi:MAG: acetylglutamate kinase [Candidatus Margulisbacteria bacterium]|nr:acetylglutamate kinase [Candidatus Margulisiibacteriota bacterium]
MFEKLIKRAKFISEALPYIMRFHDKVIVIKYGGSAMIDPELKKNLLADVVLLKYVGMHPILVHGGGPAISNRLKRLKVESKFIQGLRVTSKKVMKVVENVLGKKVNQEIVSLLKKNGGKAKGFYGKKGKVIKAKKIWVKNGQGNYHDLGFTGQVAGIRYRFLRKWMKKGYIPVLAPIGVGHRGQRFNINADSAAASVAEQLGADKLILITDVHGVLDKEGKLVSEVDSDKVERMIKNKIISGGMIPKVKCGLHALKKGVDQVHIVNGQIPNVLLLELFTDHGVGTMVVK